MNAGCSSLSAMKSAISRLRGAGGLGDWRREDVLLLLMASAVPLSFAAWQALLNNFAVERAAFTGAEMGILQSLREVPGFLAFAVVFLLLILREQVLAYLALLLLGIGTAVTGYFPSVVGLYATTVIMSLGYHYYETVQISLSLQWIEKARAPETLGRIIAASSFASIVTFGLIWLASPAAVFLSGAAMAAVSLALSFLVPQLPAADNETLLAERRVAAAE